MSETKTNSPQSPKRRSWLRKLAWLGGIVIILLVVLYFVATSAAFLKGVILPRVSASLGADVTVAGAEISPFSHVALRDLKVQPPGGETLLAVPSLRADYSLWAILGGKLAVTDVTIDSPVITVVENADGTSNLDAFTKAKKGETKPASQPAQASKPMQFDIQKVALNNATVRLVKKYPNGGQDVTEVSGLNFTVNHLQSGQTGKITLAAAIAVQKAAQANAAAGSLQAALTGGFDLALTADSKPASADGKIVLSVSQAAGSLTDFKDFAATLNCELTPTDLKGLALQLTRAGEALGQIQISGPFDAAKTEGKLQLVVSGVDQRALNLAAEASGMKFGTTTFNSTNEIDLAKGGKAISVIGQLNLANLQVIQNSQSSPTLNLRGDYAVAVDQTAQSAVLQKLQLNGTQDGRDLLLAGLTSPMTIALGGGSSAAGDATLNLKVLNLNLADWRAFTGASAPGGVLNLALNLTSQKGGQQLGFQLNSRLDNLTTGAGSATVNQGNVQLQAAGSVANLKQVKLDNFQATVDRQGKTLATVNGSGTVDTATQDADLQVAAQTALASLLAVPGAGANDGLVNLRAHVVSQQKQITLNSELALTPTDRATNILTLTGAVDARQPDAITGNLKISADALDVTRYYDLLSRGKAAANPAATPAPAPAAGPQTEPAAVNTPLKNFTVALNIGHLFLHDVDIANWQTTTLINGGNVIINPCQLTLNGAPVKADVQLNLGVPGYVYDVAFDANAVPLTPLVNSFAPDRAGQIGGVATIGTQIKGAGVTGAGLQKNLQGQFGLAATNLNLSLANVRSPLMDTVINVIVGLPNLISNPAATLGNWLGGGASNSGWANALTASPIDALTVQAQAGGGAVKLQTAEVRSAAFLAQAGGQIGLAPVLDNSTLNIPVQVSLSRALGGQIGLVNASTPTNVVYVPMPDFLTMEGTLGKPAAKINKLALLKLAATTTGGITGRVGGAVGGQVGSAVNAIGGLLDGNHPASTNAAPATNATPIGGLLKMFGK